MRVFDIHLVNAIHVDEGFSIDSAEIVEAIVSGESVFLTNGSNIIAAVTPVDDVTEQRVSQAIALSAVNDQ
jgi:antitoxin (DNA-binding transcriptional repressor) of toxin-antitoxin stability system